MRFYTCDYCFKDFEPTRRRVQKYCSNTCRSKAYHARKTSNEKSLASLEKDTGLKLSELITPNPKTKIEAVSLAGVGNAAIGSLAADGIKAILTLDDNKTATKGDLKKMTEQIMGRYHRINNIPPRIDGALPYFDVDTGYLVYSFVYI